MTDDKQPVDATRVHEVAQPEVEEVGAKKAKFELPKVITYSGDDILEELGPAHACNPFSGSVVAC